METVKSRALKWILMNSNGPKDSSQESIGAAVKELGVNFMKYYEALLNDPDLCEECEKGRKEMQSFLACTEIDISKPLSDRDYQHIGAQLLVQFMKV